MVKVIEDFNKALKKINESVANKHFLSEGLRACGQPHVAVSCIRVADTVAVCRSEVIELDFKIDTLVRDRTVLALNRIKAECDEKIKLITQ